MSTTTKDREKKIFHVSLVGIIGNVLLAGIKAVIGLISGSIAITLDAVNNLTDAVSNVITVIGIKLAGKSPSKKHPFGYGRTEYLSTLLIAVLILYAGVTAVMESVKSILEPEEASYSVLMIVVLAIAILTKIFLGLLFTKKGASYHSDSLKASGKEALFDALVSAATVVAAVVNFTLHIGVEAYLSVIISLIIVKSGIEVLLETVSKILGEGAEAALVRDVKKTIASHPGVRGAYDLVFNNYGEDTYVASVHIEVADTLYANEIDILTREITEEVYAKHGLLLTAIGIYSYNTSDEEAIAVREKVRELVTAHEHVHQMHGFYMDKSNKIIRFDMVVSFEAKDRAKLYEDVIEHLNREFEGYQISASMDSDFNELQ